MSHLTSTDHTQSVTWLSPYLASRRKLRLDRPVFWTHHRGGWKQVVQRLGEHVGCLDGMRVLTAVEETMFSGEVIREPWVGFLHEVPHHRHIFPDLQRVLQLDTWKASVDRCHGLWVLCSYLKDFLAASGLRIPVNVVYYPVESPEHGFSVDSFLARTPRRVLFVGDYLRIPQHFYTLEAPGYHKVLLRSLVSSVPRIPRANVTVLDHVTDDVYDRLLTDSLVFLSLKDAPANTTIVECIARATPVLVNRIGGIAEYLGPTYPFYYSSLAEATEKLQDTGLIAEVSAYLKQWQMKDKITFGHFLTSIQNSAIYRELPLPNSQRTSFKSYDLTILMCSYRRIDSLTKALEQLANQSAGATFEVIIWNNNREATQEVQALADGFDGRLAIKTIHSSENFYCIVRLAVASLMRSDLLLIIDDDVEPSSTYVATFLQKYQHYGPDVALCARGHVFLPHRLDEEHPERVWQTSAHMRFYDETVADCPVHFMHADNCLIPRKLLVKAIQYPLRPYEFALIDDYWLSFVLSHHLNVPLWKIEAGEAFTFSNSATDLAIAMFHNKSVKEQRINFYIHHMRQGWPYKEACDVERIPLPAQ